MMFWVNAFAVLATIACDLLTQAPNISKQFLQCRAHHKLHG